MFGLRVVQAEFGDSLLLEFGTDARRYILIDGGPDLIYERHLKKELKKIAEAGGKLDRVILSHVDGDHVLGLIDFFADLRDADAYIAIDGVWMNSFTNTPEGAGLEPKIRALGAAAPMTKAAATVQTIGDGNSLTILATQLGLPINDEFPGKMILVDTAPKPLTFDNIEMTVVGPTRANLEALRVKWEEWLAKHENAIQSNDPFVMANSDKSVPNLSSVMLYVKSGDATMLLTGDGRSDHLLEGLADAGLLDANGNLHVTLLKLPHHGSDRNATRNFFKRVTADVYVACANGKDGNPDTSTLIWIVEAAKEAGRRIKIYATNETPSLVKLREEYDAAEYGYELAILPKAQSSELLTL
jgi:beta-lactamase superfamily II metal-dependent hydrolase